jgi:Holliday junction resolvase RusA-like endonuclease
MTFAFRLLCEVRIDGIPKGQPRARSSKFLHGVYDPGTADGWKAIVVAALTPHRPSAPLEGPVAVDLDLFFPRPKTFNKRTREIYGGRSRDVPDELVLYLAKPDRDNADKAILDAMVQCGFLRDDALVVDGRIRKFYHEAGGRSGAVVRVLIWQPVGLLGTGR